MNLDYGKGFYKTHEKRKEDTFTVKLNSKERQDLETWKKLIQQPKDSTCIKQLANIGAKVIHDKKTAEILQIIMNNYRKNKRLGIVDFDKFKQK
jgi:hypothetical protein